MGQTIAVGKFGKYIVIIGDNNGDVAMVINYLNFEGMRTSMRWSGKSVEDAEQVALEFINNTNSTEEKIMRARQAYQDVMNS